jgi:hypothetical protein
MDRNVSFRPEGCLWRTSRERGRVAKGLVSGTSTKRSKRCTSEESVVEATAH